MAPRFPSRSALRWAAPATSAFLILFAFTPGCGGSGGSGDAGPASTSGVEQTIGPFITRAVGTTQDPVVERGDYSVITGIAGATFTSIIERTAAEGPAPTPTPRGGFGGGTNSWSGTRYVMSTTQFGNEDIFVSKTNTTGVLEFDQLTKNSGVNTLPAWSPDAKQIAFVSNRDGNQEIYTMNADGTNVQRLTNDPNIDTEPAWSPDGKKIAFTSRRSGNREIYVMNADGTDPVNITNNAAEDRSPAWSNDSKVVVFSSNRTGQYDIYSVYSDGSHEKNLTNTTDANEYEPAVRSDGNVFTGFTIVFVREGKSGSDFRELWSMDSEGQQLARVYTGVQDANIFRPRLSAYSSYYGGSTLTFVSDYQGRTYGGYSGDFPNGGSYRIVSDSVQSIVRSNYHTISLPPTPTPTPTPTPAPRNLVGSGGIVASASAGFLYGMRRSVSYDNGSTTGLLFTSFVAFDTVAAGRNDARVTPIAQETTDYYGVGIILFSVTAGDNKVTSLRYLNASENKVVYAVGGPGSAPAAGVLIYFNPANGEVDTVLPYDATKAIGARPTIAREGNTLVVRGNFRGAFDARGKNLAPNGLHEVRIDRSTGKVVL